MRHLGSLAAGVLIAPLAWLLMALGQEQSAATIGRWVQINGYHATDLIRAACLLAAAGILLGLIATLRVSPLGPLVAGLLLVGVYVGMFIRPLGVRAAVPGHWNVFGQTIHPRLPLDNGTVLLVGALLLVAVTSAGRWRGRSTVPAAGLPEQATPAHDADPGSPVAADPPAGPAGAGTDRGGTVAGGVAP